MNRPLVFLMMGFVFSLMLLSTVSGSTSVNQYFFLCNNFDWTYAHDPGQVQINVCNNGYGYGYGSNQESVKYEIKYEGTSIVSGGCNGGPCSNPTIANVNTNSYLILRFYPSYISGIQVIEPDGYGHAQPIWVPYNQLYYQNGLNCNPYYQFCFTQSQWSCSYSQSCSAVIFRIAATPITVNVFFSL
jgi:hypothetical protein